MKVIENPATGEKITFIRTGKDTDGQLLMFDICVSPEGFVTAEHIHPNQTEHFVVHEGTLCLKNKGKEKIIMLEKKRRLSLEHDMYGGTRRQ